MHTSKPTFKDVTTVQRHFAKHSFHSTVLLGFLILFLKILLKEENRKMTSLCPLGGSWILEGRECMTDRSRHYKIQERTAVTLIFARWTGFLCWRKVFLLYSHQAQTSYVTTMVTYYAPVWKAVLRWWAEWRLHMWPGRVNSMVSITRRWAPNWKSRELTFCAALLTRKI